MADLSPKSMQWLQVLRGHGYKLTPARRAIVEFLSQNPQPINPAEAYEMIHPHYPAIGRMTVYRAMEQLASLGLIRRVHTGCHSFVAVPAGHWNLLTCEGCGQTNYLPADGLVAEVEDKSGFVVRSHWLHYFGVCAACQQKQG